MRFVLLAKGAFYGIFRALPLDVGTVRCPRRCNSTLIGSCGNVVGMDVAQAIWGIEEQVGRISLVQKFLLGTD